jgi:hypothetical protein
MVILTGYYCLCIQKYIRPPAQLSISREYSVTLLNLQPSSMVLTSISVH